MGKQVTPSHISFFVNFNGEMIDMLHVTRNLVHDFPLHVKNDEMTIVCAFMGYSP